MSFSHHGTPGKMNPETEAILKRLSDQIDRKAMRKYPDGRIGADDDGELALAVTADPVKGVVMIHFGKPVEWIGLPPQEVMRLCEMLMQQARSIAKEPLALTL